MWFWSSPKAAWCLGSPTSAFARGWSRSSSPGANALCSAPSWALVFTCAFKINQIDPWKFTCAVPSKSKRIKLTHGSSQTLWSITPPSSQNKFLKKKFKTFVNYYLSVFPRHYFVPWPRCAKQYGGLWSSLFEANQIIRISAGDPSILWAHGLFVGVGN
jgi:hypothetical protein